MRSTVLFLALLSGCDPNGGSKEDQTCELSDLDGYSSITISAGREIPLVPGERSWWAPTEGQPRDCAPMDDSMMLYDVGQMNVGPDTTVSLDAGVSVVASRVAGDPGPIHLEVGDSGSGRIRTVGSSLHEIRTSSATGRITRDAFGQTLDLAGPSALWPTEGETMTVEGSAPETVVTVEWGGDDYGNQVDAQGQVEIDLGEEYAFTGLRCLATASTVHGIQSGEFSYFSWSCADVGEVVKHLDGWEARGQVGWGYHLEDEPVREGSLAGQGLLTTDSRGVPESLHTTDPDSALSLSEDGFEVLAAAGPLDLDLVDGVVWEARLSQTSAPKVQGTLRWLSPAGSEVVLPPLTVWERPGLDDLTVRTPSEALNLPDLGQLFDEVTLQASEAASFTGEARHLRLQNDAGNEVVDLAVDLADLRGAASIAAGAEGWLAQAGGQFTSFTLRPAGAIDLTVVLPAGAYTFDCAGPCPELPAGITDGIGPFVELVPEVGWSGALVLSLSD